MRDFLFLLLLLSTINSQLSTSLSAATVTGNLTDISLAPLTTKMLFTPTTNVLLTASGLSAGPPKMVTTSAGSFSVDLEAGDYTVSLPLITYRAPFRISVFSTNGTVNITNLLAAPVTYTYTWQPLAPLHVNTSRVTVWSTNGLQTMLDSTCTLPAGALTAGKVITIDAFGLSSDPASNGPDLTFTLKLGSTTIWTATKPPPAPTGISAHWSPSAPPAFPAASPPPPPSSRKTAPLTSSPLPQPSLP